MISDHVCLGYELVNPYGPWTLIYAFLQHTLSWVSQGIKIDLETGYELPGSGEAQIRWVVGQHALARRLFTGGSQMIVFEGADGPRKFAWYLTRFVYVLCCNFWVRNARTFPEKYG